MENECPICHGAGYLRVEVPVGHPNFGRLFPCECKMNELEERHRGELERMSNLDAVVNKTFERFDSSVKGTKDAYNAARKYAANPDGWLLLLGGYGCGKTHLAAAIANEAIKKGIPTLFANAPDLLDHLRSTFAPDSPTKYDTLFDRVRQVALLIIDDLGTQNGTPWANEKLYQIINHRYNYRYPTVITTNQRLEDIEPRIRSRICDRSLCTQRIINAVDYRSRDGRAK
jgi:DNA replication protein DnaC